MGIFVSGLIKLRPENLYLNRHMTTVGSLQLKAEGVNLGQRWKADATKLKGTHKTDGFGLTLT